MAKFGEVNVNSYSEQIVRGTDAQSIANSWMFALIIRWQPFFDSRLFELNVAVDSMDLSKFIITIKFQMSKYFSSIWGEIFSDKHLLEFISVLQVRTASQKFIAFLYDRKRTIIGRDLPFLFLPKRWAS